MIDELTPESVASEVKLLRDDANNDSTFLFVEGETDAIFFGNFVSMTNCTIRSLNGRDKVLTLISLLENDNYSGFLAIVDADFWHIENRRPQNQNICVTDFHDLEIMLVNSHAFEKVLQEYIPKTKFEELQKFPKGIRHIIYNVAVPIGDIRWVNHKYRLNISFYEDYEKTIYLDWEDAIIFEKNRVFTNPNKLLEKICPTIHQRQSIREKIRKESILRTCDIQLLCNGHDVVFVIFVLIKKYGRRKDVERLTHKDVEKSLRLAYEAKYFIRTDLYNQLLNWQNDNQRTILSI